jgi:neutral ceramidase
MVNASDCSNNTRFRIGAGIHDITGPAAARVMLGYVNFTEQFTSGIHMRLRSRAFVFESECNGKRIVFVSADLGMIFGSVKREVVRRLRQCLDEDTYSDENVIISATHTHSGPGGYSHHLLYNAISLSFDERNFETIVSGICKSILKAHRSLTSGSIRIGVGQLAGASKNRSPEAYLRNPDKGGYTCNTDRDLTLLRLTADDERRREVGVINWFAVHGTSLSKDNRLISGDNKGYASYLFEKALGTDYLTDVTFVAAFAQSNEGDVSPNVYYDGGGKDGRYEDEFSSLEASATAQCQAALEVFEAAPEVITGGIDYRHVYVDLADEPVAAAWTDGAGPQQTCSSAIGVSKLAGAEDGRGPGLLVRVIPEGVSTANFTLPRRVLIWVAQRVIVCLVKWARPFFWQRKARRRLAGGLLVTPRKTDCQGPKPILLPTGSMRPDPWTQNVLPLQLATIGQLAIIAVPFECTTMAGRRIRAAVRQQLESTGVRHYVIAGLANDYGGYVTTREEYGAQHYEGASTEFGPWQLDAIRQRTAALAAALRDGETTPSTVEPADPKAIFDLPEDLDPVNYDSAPGGKFGAVRIDAKARYRRAEKVRVSFWAGHPARDFQTQGTFLEVQRKAGDDWESVARDWDPETRFSWRRRRRFLIHPHSEATIEWTVPPDQPPGIYRIVHQGHAKLRSGRLEPYEGTSRTFEVGAG